MALSLSIKKTLWLFALTLLLAVLSFSVIDLHGIFIIFIGVFIVAILFFSIFFYLSLILKTNTCVSNNKIEKIFNIINYIYIGLFLTFILINIVFFSNLIAFDGTFLKKESINWDTFYNLQPSSLVPFYKDLSQDISGVILILNIITWIFLGCGILLFLLNVIFLSINYSTLFKNNELDTRKQTNVTNYWYKVLYYSFDVITFLFSFIFAPVFVGDSSNIIYILISTFIMLATLTLKIIFAFKLKKVKYKSTYILPICSLLIFAYSLLMSGLFKVDATSLLTNYDFSKTFIYVLNIFIICYSTFLLGYFYHKFDEKVLELEEKNLN